MSMRSIGNFNISFEIICMCCQYTQCVCLACDRGHVKDYCHTFFHQHNRRTGLMGSRFPMCGKWNEKRREEAFLKLKA